MPTASLEEIRAKVSTGEYAVGSREIAAEILTKFELVRKVRPLLMGEDEGRERDVAGRASPPQRRQRSEPADQPKPRRERLS